MRSDSDGLHVVYIVEYTKRTKIIILKDETNSKTDEETSDVSVGNTIFCHYGHSLILKMRDT